MSRTIVITGASDGIGAAAARIQAGFGDELVLVGRSPEKTKAIAAELGADYFLADFTDLSQVKTLALALEQKYPRIDVLANNAGGVMGPHEVTVDGHEKTFQVNHLAPFLLTTALMDTLVASQARIINTSSAAHRLMAKFNIDDLDAEKRYSANAAYGNAKLANILFTKELQRRYGSLGINAAAFHPGIVGSNFASEAAGFIKFAYGLMSQSFMISPVQGADTLIWLANSEPGVDWTAGEYYSKRKVTRVTKTAADPTLAVQLWDRSAAMIAAFETNDAV